MLHVTQSESQAIHHFLNQQKRWMTRTPRYPIPAHGPIFVLLRQEVLGCKAQQPQEQKVPAQHSQS